MTYKIGILNKIQSKGHNKYKSSRIPNFYKNLLYSDIKIQMILHNQQELDNQRSYGKVYPLRWGYYNNPQSIDVILSSVHVFIYLVADYLTIYIDDIFGFYRTLSQNYWNSSMLLHRLQIYLLRSFKSRSRSLII